MKKTNTMRVAVLLLALALVTSCFVGGTFAKYITSENGSETARVAKWGVVVEADSFGMFETDYATDDDTATFEGTYSVSAATGDRDDVLAPGTSGSFANIAITGTPEVAVDVAIDATVTLANWVVDHDADPETEDAFYCPVVITVGTEEFNGLDYDSAEAFAEAIAEEIEGKSAQYAPNTNLATTYDNTNLDLAWEWAFEGAADSEQTDVGDTALGNAAVTADQTISIAVAITVTQID